MPRKNKIKVKTFEELKISLAKSRGGRPTQVIKDKKKYNRKQKHKCEDI